MFLSAGDAGVKFLGEELHLQHALRFKVMGLNMNRGWLCCTNLIRKGFFSDIIFKMIRSLHTKIPPHNQLAAYNRATHEVAERLPFGLILPRNGMLRPSVNKGEIKPSSDAAIQCCLMIKSLFRLSLRMVTGFVQSLIKLCRIKLDRTRLHHAL